jgi:hypothetical protein
LSDQRRTLSPFVKSGLYRFLVGLTVGTAAYIAFQVLKIAAEASGLCTGCSAADDPGVLGAVGLGGGGAALGGGDDPPGKSRFDNWLDNVLGSGRPPPSVEAVDPPAPDPEAQRQAEEEARRLMDLYKRLIGTKGPVDMPEGSVGGELNNAFDRVFGPSGGVGDIGPPPEGSSGGGDKP